MSSLYSKLQLTLLLLVSSGAGQLVAALSAPCTLPAEGTVKRHLAMLHRQDTRTLLEKKVHFDYHHQTKDFYCLYKGDQKELLQQLSLGAKDPDRLSMEELPEMMRFVKPESLLGASTPISDPNLVSCWNIYKQDAFKRPAIVEGMIRSFCNTPDSYQGLPALLPCNEQCRVLLKEQLARTQTYKEQYLDVAYKEALITEKIAAAVVAARKDLEEIKKASEACGVQETFRTHLFHFSQNILNLKSNISSNDFNHRRYIRILYYYQLYFCKNFYLLYTEEEKPIEVDRKIEERWCQCFIQNLSVLGKKIVQKIAYEDGADPLYKKMLTCSLRLSNEEQGYYHEQIKRFFIEKELASVQASVVVRPIATASIANVFLVEVKEAAAANRYAIKLYHCNKKSIDEETKILAASTDEKGTHKLLLSLALDLRKEINAKKEYKNGKQFRDIYLQKGIDSKQDSHWDKPPPQWLDIPSMHAHQVASQDNPGFVVMDWVGGITLKKFVEDPQAREELLGEEVNRDMLLSFRQRLSELINYTLYIALYSDANKEGMYHADPHPGNIMVDYTPKEGFLFYFVDFGNMHKQVYSMDSQVDLLGQGALPAMEEMETSDPPLSAQPLRQLMQEYYQMVDLAAKDNSQDGWRPMFQKTHRYVAACMKSIRVPPCEALEEVLENVLNDFHNNYIIRNSSLRCTCEVEDFSLKNFGHEVYLGFEKKECDEPPSQEEVDKALEIAYQEYMAYKAGNYDHQLPGIRTNMVEEDDGTLSTKYSYNLQLVNIFRTIYMLIAWIEPCTQKEKGHNDIEEILDRLCIHYRQELYAKRGKEMEPFYPLILHNIKDAIFFHRRKEGKKTLVLIYQAIMEKKGEVLAYFVDPDASPILKIAEDLYNNPADLTYQRVDNTFYSALCGNEDSKPSAVFVKTTSSFRYITQVLPQAFKTLLNNCGIAFSPAQKHELTSFVLPASDNYMEHPPDLSFPSFTKKTESTQLLITTPEKKRSICYETDTSRKKSDSLSIIDLLRSKVSHTSNANWPIFLPYQWVVAISFCLVAISIWAYNHCYSSPIKGKKRVARLRLSIQKIKI